ncbi:PIK3C2B isoform 6, partial [Pan troglodytes]
MRPWSSPAQLVAGAQPAGRGDPLGPRPIPPPRFRRASSQREPPYPRPAEPALEMAGSKCQPDTPVASLCPADSPSQHRVMPPGPASWANVGSRPHTVANGHELFEVSEERDEEVAAFCHMLDILRSGSDIQDYFLTGYVWSAVTPSPEHLGDEVNLKVTVLCDRLQEALTFTC